MSLYNELYKEIATEHAATLGQPNLMCLTYVFGLWEEAEHPEETHADTGRTCKLNSERPGSSWESNPGPLSHRAAHKKLTPFTNEAALL